MPFDRPGGRSGRRSNPPICGGERRYRRVIPFPGGDLNAGLAKLDRLADGAAFVVGHNLIDFDAKYLAASNPDLRLLHLPQVDTLRLNPLAFPRNPYHHLVKHYQDGQLKHGSRNDPELDARLTLGVLRDQHQAFRAMSESAPELVLAYHWLTTVDGNVLRIGCLLCDGTSSAKTVIGEGGRGDPTSDERQGVPGAKPGGAGEPGRTGMATGLRAGLAVRLRWQLGHAALGAAPVSRGGCSWCGKLRDTPCSEPTCAWCRERHDARRELKRYFNLSEFRPEPRDAEGRSAARGDRRGRHAWRAPARDPADGHGKIALLSDPGTFAIREDRCVDRGHLAIGCAHGRPGGRTGGARYLLQRGSQRIAVDARARGYPGSNSPRRHRHLDHRSRAVAQPLDAPSAGATRDRSMGHGRGPLPVKVGPRLPSGLPIRGEIHQGEGGFGCDPTDHVPDGDRQSPTSRGTS